MQDLEATMPNYPSEAGTNDQPVSDPNRIPVALKVVAWIFILSGIWAAFDVLTALANGNLSINFGVLSFFIGLGLLRLSPVWRTWALIFTWFELICLPLAALLLLSGSGTSTGKVLGVLQVDEFSTRLAALMETMVFFLVAIWQYWTLTRSDIRLLFFSGLERKLANNTPWVVALLAFLVLGFLAGANHALIKHRASCIVAFGQATGRTPEYTVYYDRVGQELDHYLQTRGFSPKLTRPSNGSGPHGHYVAQRNIWYVRENALKNDPCVLVVQPTENMSGIDVEVQWEASDHSWRVNSLESQASALQADITAWWKQYQKNFPVPGFREGAE